MENTRDWTHGNTWDEWCDLIGENDRYHEPYEVLEGEEDPINGEPFMSDEEIWTLQPKGKDFVAFFVHEDAVDDVVRNKVSKYLRDNLEKIVDALKAARNDADIKNVLYEAFYGASRRAETAVGDMLEDLFDVSSCTGAELEQILSCENYDKVVG